MAITPLCALSRTTRAGEEVGPVAERPAFMTALAAHSLLLRVARAGNRLVAVGERGIVILSDDNGQTWRQALVPTSVTLTAVDFGSPLRGWAVGHSGVILRTENGGETWAKQLDGPRLAQLALSAAQANLRFGSSASKQTDLKAAEQLVSDGPDKPFLAVHAYDDRRALAVGAYGLFFSTDDGGKTWLPWMSRVDNPAALHIYGLAVQGRDVYLAGEQGLFERSIDGGRTFARLRPPYRGSYFAINASKSGEVLIAGLRGNAFRTRDRGAHFTRVASSTPVSFSGSAPLRDDAVALTNQAGQVWEWRPGSNAFRALATPHSLSPLAAIVQASDGALIVVGLGGALRLPLAATSYTRRAETPV